ncbi:MAG: helix-turn-helix transcriptional regulator [Candidatus Aminicenantes bacterium]|jgi:DNA-binding CsgD family transcriptional regulator
MSDFSVVFYILALFIGFLTIYLAHRLNKTYPLGYLNSYLYFLISFNIMGFLNHIGRYLGVSILMDSPEETLLLVRYLFAFLAFPFVALSIYLFIAFANDLIGTKASSLFNRLFGVFWGVLFLIQLFLARNYFYAREEHALFIFFQSVNILGTISFLLTPFYILIRSKDLTDGQQKSIARRFSLVYLLCFGMASLVTSRFLLPYFLPYTSVIMIFSFFTVNLPPVFFLIFSLRKYPIEHNHPAPQRNNSDDFFTVYKISNREREIIELILDGMSNADIEKKLYISSHTVKNHIYHIYQKLGVKNRVQISNLIRDHNQVYKD